MTVDFERQKNAQAALYTGAIALVLLLVVWFVKFYQPVVPPPQEVATIEIALPEPPPVEDVNLGNNDVGTGNVQPIVTGTPSSAPVSQDVAEAKAPTSQQATKDFDEDDDKASPPITKPAATNKNKEITDNTSNQSTVTKPDPRPKAVMTSTTGSGNGGNTDALGYNRPGGQGPGDGPGDKGTYNGNPKATNFGTKKAARAIFNKDFKGDFNQNAVVAVAVEVNGNGKVTSASYTSRGSSGTATPAMKEEAKRRAFEVPFEATGSVQKGILQFDFKVQ